MAAALGRLGAAVATGRTGMDLAYGTAMFEYLAAHPDARSWFDRAMAQISVDEPQAVADAYDFSALRRVADLGGGNGTLPDALLERHPHLHGILFDLPGAIDNLVPGLGRHGERCEVVAGDFFAAVPEDADAYLLSHVVHDWGDPRCLELLGNVRAAMGATRAC